MVRTRDPHQSTALAVSLEPPTRQLPTPARDPPPPLLDVGTASERLYASRLFGAASFQRLHPGAARSSRRACCSPGAPISGSIAVRGELPPRPQCRGEVRIARDPTLPQDLGPLSGWYQRDRLPCSAARITMCTRLHAIASPRIQKVETALTADHLVLLAGVKCSSPRFPTSPAPPPRSPSTRAASSPDYQLARRRFAPPLRPADAPSVPRAARQRA